MKQGIIGLLLVGLIFAGFIALAPLDPVLYSESYYGKLKAACAPGDGCCTGSVKNMETGGYKLAENDQCQAGFLRVAVKCPTAYSWCEPNASSSSGKGVEITYSRGGGLALWKQRITLYANGTLDVQDDNGRYVTQKSQVLDEQTRTTIQAAVTAADVANLKDEYVCQYACPTDLPTETIEIVTSSVRKTITIDDFEAVPPALTELMKALQQASEGIPNPTPAPVPLESGEQISLAQGQAIQACGYDIRLTQLLGFMGSRSDWLHQFEIREEKSGNVETLMSWGNESHVMESEKLSLNITVYQIIEPAPMQAMARTIRISVQCGNRNAKLAESYTACGCGCCGGTEPQTQCLYKAKGDDLQSIIEEDRRWAKNGQCAVMGCSLGTKYQYCD